MAVQGGWVGQKRSEMHVRNMWTAPKAVNDKDINDQTANYTVIG